MGSQITSLRLFRPDLLDVSAVDLHTATAEIGGVAFDAHLATLFQCVDVLAADAECLGGFFDRHHLVHSSSIADTYDTVDKQIRSEYTYDKSNISDNGSECDA